MKKWFETENGKLRFRAVLTSAAATGLFWITWLLLKQSQKPTINIINQFVLSFAAVGIWIVVVVFCKWLFDWFFTSQKV